MSFCQAAAFRSGKRFGEAGDGIFERRVVERDSGEIRRHAPTAAWVRSTTRSKQRPDTLMQDRICRIDETSCNARPDHTFGSDASISARSPMSAYHLTAAK